MSAVSGSDRGRVERRHGVLGGFAEFLNLEIAGSVLLLGATVLALVIANSPAHTALENLLHVEIGFHVGTGTSRSRSSTGSMTVSWRCSSS